MCEVSNLPPLVHQASALKVSTPLTGRKYIQENSLASPLSSAMKSVGRLHTLLSGTKQGPSPKLTETLRSVSLEMKTRWRPALSLIKSSYLSLLMTQLLLLNTDLMFFILLREVWTFSCSAASSWFLLVSFYCSYISVPFMLC